MVIRYLLKKGKNVCQIWRSIVYGGELIKCGIRSPLILTENLEGIIEDYAWQLSANGKFSVKSAHQLADRQSTIPIKMIWLKIWRMKGPQWCYEVRCLGSR